jgi:RNA polymerase sigma-70 factor (ECF subfamily)
MDRILSFDAGDAEVEAELVRLYREYHGDLYAYLCRLVGDRHLAEDLVQDTFVKAHRALGRLPKDANRRAWLYRIATNTALDQLRRRRLVAWLPLFDNDRHPATHTSFQEESLETIAVQRTLARLAPRYRVPLVLYTCQGLSTEEIAAILEISRGAVKTRLFRAREKFRRLYALEEVDG